jgi:hypothetical protein
MEKRPSLRYLSNQTRILAGLAAFAIAGAPLFCASSARPSGEPETALVAREFRFALEPSGAAGSEPITLVLQPRSASNQLLADRYSAVVWIDTPGGDLAGVEQLRLITRLAVCRIECAAEDLPAKSVVHGRLVGPNGETLVDFQSPIL